MDSRKWTISWIGTTLSAALIAVAGGAGAGGAFTPTVDDGASGGQGGTATAVAGEGDTATAVPGEPGSEGTEVELPLEFLNIDPPEPEQADFVLARYAAQELVGDDVEEDPDAHVDDSGEDGANVRVIGSGDEAVTVTGEHGANGSSVPASGTAEASADTEETLASASPVVIFGDRE